MNRCEGTIKNGSRCKRMLKYGNLCHSHKVKENKVEYTDIPSHLFKNGSLVVRVGTSGYYFNWWRVWYNCHQKEWFNKYSSNFSCVEINSTHYGTKSSATYERWNEMAKKKGITFSVKLNRYASHMKWLKSPESWWDKAYKEYSRLGDSLECILIQLPPRFKRYSVKGEDRLETLRKLAQFVPKGVRLVFEFRSMDWYEEDVYDVLRENNWCLAIIHLVNHLNSKGKMWMGNMSSGWSPRIYTADFTYYRLHGNTSQYKGKYGENFLCVEVTHHISTSGRKDNFVMFNNTDDFGPDGIPSAISDGIITQELFK